METTDVVIIGGGQAGIAASKHLSDLRVPHVVFERARVVERWRSERWDSLVSNGPAWHDRFPGETIPGSSRQAFASKDELVEYFENYARKFDVPMRCGINVTNIEKSNGRPGFITSTTVGDIFSNAVIVATGPFQKPIIPPIVPSTAPVAQLHSRDYRNPQKLPDGNVLVVGAGSSGAQIADEIAASNKQVFLSVGPHERPPRRYRGRDFAWWRGILGVWDVPVAPEGSEHVTMAVSGVRGGETIDYRVLAERGVTLVGMTDSYDDGRLHFRGDLRENIAHGDETYFEFLKLADRFIADNGLTLPEDREAWATVADPDCLRMPIRIIDLRQENITSIIWSTGYTLDFDWIKIAGAFDDRSRPLHSFGVSPIPGLYFLGLPWLARRESAFIWGVWHDAKYLADRIHNRRKYLSML